MDAETPESAPEAGPTSPRGSKGSRTSKGSQGSKRASLEATTGGVPESESDAEELIRQTDMQEDKKPTSKTASVATSGVAPARQPSLSKRDPLNTEFIYYSAMLKCLAPALTAETNRCRVIPWIRKLFGPEYQVEKFRTKRNKYLCSLVITLMNDEVSGVFNNSPPPGALYEVEDLACELYNQAEWETDSAWEEMCQNMPESFFNNKCTIHNNGDCKKEEDWSQDMLDREFRLFLYLVRPYAALIVNSEEKAKVSSWMQVLCCVPKVCCVAMKSLRNDYMRSLYGCVHDLCVSFPFNEYAPSPPLPVPHTLARGEPPKQRFTDPTSQDANEFLKNQPVPENGAFCYLAVSGEVLSSSMPLDHELSMSLPKVRKYKGGSSRHVEIRTSHVETTAEIDPLDIKRPCQKKRGGGR